MAEPLQKFLLGSGHFLFLGQGCLHPSKHREVGRLGSVNIAKEAEASERV